MGGSIQHPGGGRAHRSRILRAWCCSTQPQLRPRSRPQLHADAPPPLFSHTHPQSEFFTRAADLVSRRQAMLLLLAGGGGAAITTFGIKGSKDAQLPITKGPQTSGENGKGGGRNRL